MGELKFSFREKLKVEKVRVWFSLKKKVGKVRVKLFFLELELKK